AICSRSVAIVKLLLAAGARPNTLEHDDPLYWAASSNQTEMVRALVDAGTKLGIVDTLEYGWSKTTALHEAAQSGNREMFALLLRLNAADVINSFDELARTPLICAVEKGHVDVARDLLRALADVNARDHANDGHTAIGLAAREGSVEMVRTLLAAGADS